MMTPFSMAPLGTGKAYARAAQRAVRISAGALLVMALASCDDMPGSSSSSGASGFKKQYLLARTQLEKGNVQKALASYRQLAQDRSPFESRIVLELSHAYLRVADFDAARRTVQCLSKAEDTRLRAAALAVTGTAEHELALRRIASGDKGKDTRTHLKAAQSALKSMLKLHPDMDQTGAMATRLAQVGETLKGL